MSNLPHLMITTLVCWIMTINSKVNMLVLLVTRDIPLSANVLPYPSG
jgi:hypothetical protein